MGEVVFAKNSDITIYSGTIISERSNAVDVSNCEFTVYDGTFTSEDSVDSALSASDNSTITVHGGTFTSKVEMYSSTINLLDKASFQSGISAGSSSTVNLATNYAYKSTDGTTYYDFRSETPFDVVYTGVNGNYIFGFENQTPAMPEGETYVHLGDFVVGDEAAKITFGFSVATLPSLWEDEGYYTTEKMEIISYNNGVLIEKNNGNNYTIDKTIADNYCIIQTIELKNENDATKNEKIQHIFTLSIRPEGYTEDEDCPIEGAIGTGTKNDPVIVDTFAELEAAMDYEGELYVQVDGYIFCPNPVGIKGTKQLTINGVLRSFEKTLAAHKSYCKSLTLNGNGTIISENSWCLDSTTNVYLEGNITYKSPNGYVLNPTDGKVVVSGGVFNNGVASSANITNAKADENCWFIHSDGVLKTTAPYQSGEVLDTSILATEIISLRFKYQEPNMPEGKTTELLGYYNIGEDDGEITFDFSADTLPTTAINAGYEIEESMKVFSEKDGLVLEQESSRAYTTDNTTKDTYTIIQTLILKKDGNEIGINQKVFIVSIVPEDYVQDEDCPIENATGKGTSNDPVIVDNYIELKEALEYSNTLYIQVDGYIPFIESLKPNGKKILIVNGTLHSIRDNCIYLETDESLSLQGNGSIFTEGEFAAVYTTGNLAIRGDLDIISDEGHAVQIQAGNTVISGGTFKSNKATMNGVYGSNKFWLILTGRSYFPSGIDYINTSEARVTNRNNGYGYRYGDGSISNELRLNEPVDVLGPTTILSADIKVVVPNDIDTEIYGEGRTQGAVISSEKWYKVNGDGTVTEKSSGSFEVGKTYRYEVTLEAYDGFEFASVVGKVGSGDNWTWRQITEMPVYINGEAATQIKDDEDSWLDNSVTYYMDFVARKKLVPIIEKDTYFVQDGTTVEIPVDARGEGVTYGWTGVSEGAGGYYTVSDYTDRILKLEIPEGVEGTNVYMVRITDAYGETVWKTITVHITQTGFKEIKPSPTAEQFEAGVTDYGYVFPGADGSGVPKVYFEAYELSQGFIDEGYTMETSLIDYVDGVKVGEGYEAWDYTTHLPGAHEIVQKIVIKDADGNIVEEYTYTHKMNVMREFALNTVAYGTALYGYRVEVYQDGKLASEQTNGNNITMDVVAPVGDVKIVVSKNGYKAREYEATIPADGFFSLNTEILRWGDANLDDVLDVQDYQQTINKGLSDNHKLDGSYEQSVMDWAEDGYIDVIDCFYCILCINGTELFSAGVEYETYYALTGETISIPVIADGFGVTYEWKAPEGAPAIVEGTEDDDTVQIYIEEGKYNIGDKFTYSCIVRDRFFSIAELEVEVEIEHLTNLYAVTYSSQYEDVKGLPGKTRVKAGESITIPELIPQLDGYTFMYWYAGSDKLNPGDTYTPYQNTIIMPYMAKDYTITLHSGIGGEIFGTHKGNYGHYYYLPEMDELPDGYIFYGWTDVEGSTEVKYTTGYRYEIKGDADLYPVIAKASDVKLTIYANDGTDQVIYETTLAEQNGALYFTIPEDLEMPTREGYICTGFITSPDGYYYGVDKYWQGSKVAANPAGVVLYAHWELPNVLQFKGGMDGVTGLPDSVSFESPQSYQITSWLTPYCEGYEFLYWEDEEGNQYRPEDYVVVQGITTLTAVWEKLDTENYKIWISGQQLSKTNSVVQCGTGTARVVEDEWGNVTLVLDDAQITGDEGIRTEYNSLDIEVYGENTITVEGENARGITGPNGNITITGPGTLNVDVKGDNSIGIKGLYSIDYATVNVNAEAETSDGKAYGVSCLSGSQYQIALNNGATLNAKGTTYGIYNAGQLKVSKTSKVIADGDVYGIYSIYGIYDGWGGSSFGTVIASGGTGAMTTASSNYLHNYGLDSYDVKLSTMQSGLIKTDWDRYEEFCDNTTEYGYKYVEIKPTACTGEHTYTTYSGLEATCDKDGLTDGEYCSACGYIITEREYVEATGHDYHTHNGKEPTCTEQGIDGTYTQCDKCGEYQGSVTFIDATGHSWGEWILIDGTDTWYDEYGYGEREYIRYCYNCDEYERTWYRYEDPNDTGSPNESGGAGPAG